MNGENDVSALWWGIVSVHSTFVTDPQSVTGEFAPEKYHPRPGRKYRTSEKMRRTALAYYWQHREAVLDRETRRRAQQPKVSVKIQ